MKLSIFQAALLAVLIPLSFLQAMEAENIEQFLPEQSELSNDIALMGTGALLAVLGATFFVSTVPDTKEDDSCTIL